MIKSENAVSLEEYKASTPIMSLGYPVFDKMDDVEQKMLLFVMNLML